MKEDHLIPVLIDDSISCLRFFPSNEINYLASGGWDSKLRLFEIQYQIINQSYNSEKVQINSKQINICQHKSPILSMAWLGNSGVIITGCVDGSVNYVDNQKNIFNKIGQHDNGCKEVLYLDNYNVIMTGGWDGKLNIWDLRSQKPLCSYQFKNKIYTMSCGKNLLVVGLSELVMAYFNLQNLQKNIFKPESFFNSHLKEQTKKVVVFNNDTGFIEGSIEGRVAIKFINLNYPPNINKDTNCLQNEKDFAFRCHREVKNGVCYVYPINDISINPIYGSVCTAGGDGKYSIWDLQDKSRINDRENIDDNCPLTACNYNSIGNLLAYSSGYDWCKGAEYAKDYSRPKIFIHYLQNNHRNKINY